MRQEVHDELLCDFLDVLSPGATIRFFDFELNLFAFFGGLEFVHQKSGIVEEVILAILSVDETEALLLVEHFDCSLHETPNLPSVCLGNTPQIILQPKKRSFHDFLIDTIEVFINIKRDKASQRHVKEEAGEGHREQGNRGESKFKNASESPR